MLERLDRFFLHFAKRMILIAAFFGIHRKKLAEGVTIGGYFSCFGIRNALEMITDKQPRPPVIIVTIVFALTAFFWYFFFERSNIEKNYREDNILSNYLLRESGMRLLLLSIMPIGSLFMIRFPIPIFFISLLFLFPPQFYIYILLNQSPQNPLRLRNLVKSAFGKIKTAFRPAPQLQPEPILLRCEPSPTA